MALEPQIILMDEPATGLNNRETVHLADIIRKIRDSGVTVVLVEHDMELIMDICDSIVVLDLGRKLAEGTPREIQENPAVIAAYLGRGECYAENKEYKYILRAGSRPEECLFASQCRRDCHSHRCERGGQDDGTEFSFGHNPSKNGEIVFDGSDITSLSPDRIVDLGISQVPEGRQVFKPLSVEDNLELGAYLRYRRREGRGTIKKDVENIFSLFPRLRERRKQMAGTLSGGEQQMLAIGRPMTKPGCCFDEPSMGLALVVRKFWCYQRVGRRVLSFMLNRIQGDSCHSRRGYVLKQVKYYLRKKASGCWK
jgi:branched-chain amino acid transport system ATP-binding protein